MTIEAVVESPVRGADRCYFGGMEYDRRSGVLVRDGDPVALRPKSSGVLDVLLARRGDVVNKVELLATVWPEGFVGDDALTGCISELREALGDDARQPRFIATAHRRGYRFVAPVSHTAPAGDATADAGFVGRERELAELHDWWRDARAGRLRVAFVAGEGGVGKSSLVGEFVQQLQRREHVLVGRGQCVERHGGAEPHLPFLDALAGLCRGLDGEIVRRSLAACAPSWLTQLPGVLDGPDAESLLLRLSTPAVDRMRREFVAAMHDLTATAPVVLVCEDLHSGDRATADLLRYLALHPDPPPVLVLCTYRPAEAFATAHPVRDVVAELRSRQRCRLLRLDRLPPAAVKELLARRLAPRRPSGELVADVVGRTDGNPLFLVTLLDHLTERDLLDERPGGEVSCREDLTALGLPDSVHQMVARQLAALGPETAPLLEVAAVAGIEFTSAAVQAGLADESMGLAEVEERLDALARPATPIVPAGLGSSPDGTVSTRYRFSHAMIQEVLWRRMPHARRLAVHHRLGCVPE